MTPGKRKTIQWAGETIALLPERAIWWPRQKALFIADPHFGKASAFRSAGIPAPETSHEDDLARLEYLLQKTRAKKLIILGDFFHARSGRSAATMLALAEWRDRRKTLEIVLIRGNHDRHAGAPPKEWNIQGVDAPLCVPPFICVHEPVEAKTGFVLAGHIHPSFSVGDLIGSARLPCFHFSSRIAVLPAFGNFTGTHGIRPKATDRIFVIAENEVIDVSALIREKRLRD